MLFICFFQTFFSCSSKRFLLYLNDADMGQRTFLSSSYSPTFGHKLWLGTTLVRTRNMVCCQMNLTQVTPQNSAYAYSTATCTKVAKSKKCLSLVIKIKETLTHLLVSDSFPPVSPPGGGGPPPRPPRGAWGAGGAGG